ncbi:MAG: tRNA uridine-5-carboxymethylaminomethyl(34) synthesis GTPase MnmE [Clostridia bacterium]
MLTDTIAAVGTALSNSGISIIRISGNESKNIINKIFVSSKELSKNTIVFGKIKDEENIVDNVLVSYFKSPKSFTGEDICEINCHGGIQVTKQVLDIVLKNGARLASPGEFSKRAFLNGKMDLSQAESVIDLITSKTKIESKIAAKHLEGDLSKNIRLLREDLVELLAKIEVSIDYPEYDYEEVEPRAVKRLLDKKIKIISGIVDTYEQGRYIKNGVNVAILGRPNVGKSSLLNKLAKYEKAIVTNIPGTTRDIVEETINIGDIVLNISDTAGIRDTEDIIEKIGVEKTIKKLEEVDLVIYMLNAEEKIDKSDLETLSIIQNKGLKLITAINKMDKYKETVFNSNMEQLNLCGIKEVVEISIYNDEGVENLKKHIITMFNKSDFDFEHELIITNERHKNLLKNSVEYLINAKEEIKNNNPIDIIEIYIKNATKALGEIIGTDVSQDVVDKIFEKFCLGK